MLCKDSFGRRFSCPGIAALICFSMTAGPAVYAEDEITRQSTPADKPLWNAAWLTDTQSSEPAYIARLVDAISTDHPKIVLHTGDANFHRANEGAWREVLRLQRAENPPAEFHLARGNHDGWGAFEPFLLKAATRGVYPVSGMLGLVKDVSGPDWPLWNPEVLSQQSWQPGGREPYRYVFKRGGIRFIVLDCYVTDAQTAWVRDFIVKPDDSSVTIIVQHDCSFRRLAKYVEGLDGRHNVKAVLVGHDHNFKRREMHGVTFIEGAGIFWGRLHENDAMVLRVYCDHLQMDRYVLPAGSPPDNVQAPQPIWTCSGQFSEYQRPVDNATAASRGPACAVAQRIVPGECAPVCGSHGSHCGKSEGSPSKRFVQSGELAWSE